MFHDDDHYETYVLKFVSNFANPVAIDEPRCSAIQIPHYGSIITRVEILSAATVHRGWSGTQSIMHLVDCIRIVYGSSILKYFSLMFRSFCWHSGIKDNLHS